MALRLLCWTKRVCHANVGSEPAATFREPARVLTRGSQEMYFPFCNSSPWHQPGFQGSESQSVSYSAITLFNLCLASNPFSLLPSPPIDKSKIEITSQGALSFNSSLQNDPNFSAFPSTVRTASPVRNYYRLCDAYSYPQSTSWFTFPVCLAYQWVTDLEAGQWYGMLAWAAKT